MIDWFNSLGITVAQVLTATGAVVLAYVSARFGARESRRQYEEKAEIDRRRAAVELIHPLLAFAFECERRARDIGDHRMSGGHAGDLHNFSDLTLPAECNRHAAAIDGRVAARVLKIQIFKTRMESTLASLIDLADDDDDGEIAERVESWLYLLALKAKYATDLAAKAAGLPASHSDKEMEALLKAAMQHGGEIDSGDEDRWT